MIRAIIDSGLPRRSRQELAHHVDEIVEISGYPFIRNSFRHHPDLHFCYEGKTLFYNPYYEKIAARMGRAGVRIKKGAAVPAGGYPGDTAYNVLRSGRHAFHDFRYTDPGLLSVLRKKYALVHVSQGYANCSSLDIDGTLFTSDGGIRKACEGLELPVFHFDNRDILLPGYPYGFLGGCCGKLDGTFFFTGDPGRHRDGKMLLDYLDRKKISWIALPGGKMRDAGSIIFVSP